MILGSCTYLLSLCHSAPDTGYQNIYVDYLTATSEAEAAKILDGNSATLLSAVNDSSPLYSGLAEVLYEKYADGVFLEYTPLPEILITNKSKNVSSYNDTAFFVPHIFVYPNPTNDIVFVEYNLGYSMEEGMDLLFDVLGKPSIENCNIGILNLYTSDSRLIYSTSINQNIGIEGINMQEYPSGMYLIEIIDCHRNANSVKIIKCE